MFILIESLEKEEEGWWVRKLEIWTGLEFSIPYKNVGCFNLEAKF